VTNSRLELELDRVAGESKVNVYLVSGEVRVEYASQLSERLFERLVAGRDHRYAPYIAARICGVCSHAHFWASNLAIENALGIEVDEVTAILRDVCNKLQIVENHLVYLIFLALPDYRELEAGIVTKAIRAREIIKTSLNTLCGRLSSPQPYMPGGFIKEITPSTLRKQLN
jgi:Coenzyme F420-reducing hydrogenase, alpha subunit